MGVSAKPSPRPSVRVTAPPVAQPVRTVTAATPLAQVPPHDGDHPHAAEELARFYASLQGQGFSACRADAFDGEFAKLKNAVAEYARGVCGGMRRLHLFQGIHDQVEELRACGFTRATYALNQSFIGDDEANLIVLKLLHTPMTQDAIAVELGCSYQAVNTRVKRLQDGVRLGDMGVTIAPSYGGRLESTVHPVLLPLNLSEVYVLLSTLEKAAAALSDADPHAAIMRDVAEKVSFQLSPYARERVAARLAEMGLHVRDGVPPAFELETRPGPRDQGQAGRNGSRRPVRLSANWLYLEKAGVPVRVTCSGNAPDGERVCVGTLAPGVNPADYPDQLGGRSPATCFALRRPDRTIAILSWGDVLDIEMAADIEPR